MKFPHNPVRAARRKTEIFAEHDADQPRCIYCGNTNPLVVRRRRIANHHLFSNKRDSMEAPVCLNCHAVAHEELQDADVPMIWEKDPTKFARAIFRALAVHFSLLAKACWRFAKRMEKRRDS
jgi:hypothetical protein